ncbi:MAG: lipid II flippase MurJ, partial [bacterium]|nr:lipid II flippase MurJ [bacterium]
MDRQRNTFLRTAFGLSLISIIGKLLGFGREQIIAWRFGAGALVDGYVAALTVPQILAGIIGGAVAAAFLPVYIAEREKNPQNARRLATTIIVLALAITLMGTLLVYAFTPSLVATYVGSFSAEQQATTAGLIRIMASGAVFICIATVLATIFNAHQIFFV